MNSFKTTGIILRRHDYGEADRIYEFMTPEGKRAGVAKGVRKAKARLAGHLELFCEIELMMVTGRGRAAVITSARQGRRHELSHDYDRMRRGYLFLEMADKLTDTEGTADIYGLLAAGLQSLASNDPYLTELWFKLRLLQLLGQAPRLDKDSGNAALETGKSYTFDVGHGNLRPVTAKGNISADAIKLWRLAGSYEPSKLEKIGRASDTAARSLELLDRFIQEQTGKRFKAADM